MEEPIAPLPKRVLDPVHEALETFPYGLYIIGSRGSDNVNAMMADWVMQVSFAPRLVAVSLERNSTTLRNLRETGVFSVNILPAAQRTLAVKFCQPRDASKIVGRSEKHSAHVYDKLRDVDYREGELTGCAILEAALSFLECEVHELVDVGDHTLALGRVLDGNVQHDGEPLTNRILGWQYAG
ncbi:MAG TPA: flavin reductase family protein [Dehalococcoidia bacterium]|nr:flavin reductase family protein [Dehalococcoidia bacterium]